MNVIPPSVGTGRAVRAVAPGAPLPVRLANASWKLRATRLVLRTLTFRGVVTVRGRSGSVRMLRFTARSVDAVGLDVTVRQGGTTLRLRAREAATSTLKGRSNGVVTLYLRELTGTVAARAGTPLPPHGAVTVTPDAIPSWLTNQPAPARTLTLTGATASHLTACDADLIVPGPQIRVGVR
ncbi:hypothetical protein [Streptomyces adustus]